MSADGGQETVQVTRADGEAMPDATLNWSATANPVANAAVVARGAGRVNPQANASTDVVVDVVGYYQ